MTTRDLNWNRPLFFYGQDFTSDVGRCVRLDDRKDVYDVMTVAWDKTTGTDSVPFGWRDFADKTPRQFHGHMEPEKGENIKEKPVRAYRAS